MPYAGTSFGSLHYTEEEMMEMEVFTFNKFLVNEINETVYDYRNYLKEIRFSDSEIVRELFNFRKKYYYYLKRWTAYQKKKKTNNFSQKY